MSLFKRKAKPSGKNEVSILSPLAGDVIPVTDVSDPVFSEEMLGKGVAIHPSAGRLVSPVSGVVTQMFDTSHAVTITSDTGAEILIHIGMDTVKLKGEHFTPHVKTDDKVSAGDLLIEFDLEAIAIVYETVTPIVVCNYEDYSELHTFTAKSVAEGEEIIVLKK